MRGAGFARIEIGSKRQAQNFWVKYSTFLGLGLKLAWSQCHRWLMRVECCGGVLVVGLRRGGWGVAWGGRADWWENNLERVGQKSEEVHSSCWWKLLPAPFISNDMK